MSNESTYKIFTPTNCISEQAMYDYIDKKLSPKEQHMVEKHLIDCEFCSDAVEGLQLVKDRNRTPIINKIIQEKIAAPEKKIISINYKLLMSIAAGILLLAGAVFFFNQFSQKSMHEDSLADLKEPAKDQTAIELSPPPPPASMQDSTYATTAAATDALTEESNGTTTRENKKSTIVLEDKEQEETVQPLEQTVITENATGKGEASKAGDISDGLKKESPPQASKTDEANNNSFHSTTTSADVMLPNNNNTTKETGGKDEDDSKAAPDKKAEEKKSEQEQSKNNEGYYAQEDAQTKTKALEKSGDYKDKDKKADKDKAAAVPAGNTGASNTVAYEPIDLAQKQDQTIKTDTINAGLSELNEETYDIADESPKFPGGDAELIKYVLKNLDLNQSTNGNEIKSKVIIQFIVDKNGKAQKAKLIQPVNAALEKQVADMINKMPLWQPGKIKGKPVAVRYNLPFNINVK